MVGIVSRFLTPLRGQGENASLLCGLLLCGLLQTDWQQPSTKEAESALARFKRMCRMHKQLPGSLHPPRSYLPDKGSKDQNPDTSLTTPPDTQSCSSHCCVCSDREQKKGRMRELRTAEHHCRLGRNSRSPLCSED